MAKDKGGHMVKNMTAGSPIRLILSFTVPLLIGNVFQQFYNIADIIIVGRTIGSSDGPSASMLWRQSERRDRCSWPCWA